MSSLSREDDPLYDPAFESDAADTDGDDRTIIHDAQDDPVLAGLTDAQREAVTTTEGPVLVLAGPGSGKTRVITRRIAHLIGLGVPAWQILALTFTNKAAAEMRERVGSLLDPGVAARGLTISTFHALCARLLRRHIERAREEMDLGGLTGDYTIYDTADQTALLKRTLKDLDLSTTNWPPRSVLSQISGAKNKLQDAGAYAAEAGDFYSKSVARIFTAYERGLRGANAVDFDDLLVLTARMLKGSRAVRDACRDRWRYILIDEYQDTNHAQFVIASLLAGDPSAQTPPNICVVGDPDQSIYGWRGADIGNILEFEKLYPTTTVIPLGENFRSTGRIIAAADTLIRKNKRRKHKDLTTSNPEGDKVSVTMCRDEHHEARLVTDWFRGLHEGGSAWKEMAVMYRTNALSRVIEDELRTAGVPYVIARGTAFYQREEIKHAVAYLRVIANPADDVPLERIINTPARGIGSTSLARVRAVATERGVPMVEALRGAGSLDLTPRATNAIAKFLTTLDGWSGSGSFMGADVAGSLSELVERVVRESGLEGMYKAGKQEQDVERLENLDELVSSAADFESTYDPTDDAANDLAVDGNTVQADVPPLLALLRGYLERVTLVADADAVDPSQGAVTLMTLHAAKGLEFPAVAMIGLEEGTLPHTRGHGSDEELEEERRLCFVGITRAMRHLSISSARYRTIRGVSERTMPSRFLDELPVEHVQVSDQASGDLEWDHDDIDVHDRLERARGRASFVEDAPQHGVRKGAFVRHPQFGVGLVESITRGADARAKIRFRDVGPKTLVLQYARLEVLHDDG